MSKSADAFRTISEVADWLDTPTHVLRFWESKFSQIKPVKRAGGRRYYRPKDMLLIGGIKRILHEDGLTIKGAQKILREQGAKHVSSLSQPLSIGEGLDGAADIREEPTKEYQAADWQPIQIFDFATEVSEENVTALLPSSEQDVPDPGIEGKAASASQIAAHDGAQDDNGKRVDPITVESLDNAPKPDNAVEPAQAVISSSPAANIRPKEPGLTNRESKSAKTPTDVKADFKKSQSSLDDDQPTLNLWSNDNFTNAPETKLKEDPLLETAPLVEPKHDSVMAHLSSHDNFDKYKVALLKPILLKLEKRLEQRKSRQYI
jgi:DNA-binding transcriptional MerR regulator